jgi:enamine deaminase RidA (YjgF/YER057c/UK114 family)
LHKLRKTIHGPPQYINPKDLKHRSDVAVWKGVAYVAGIVPPDNTFSIAEHASQALAVIEGRLAGAGIDKPRLLIALIHLADVERDVVAVKDT